MLPVVVWLSFSPLLTGLVLSPIVRVPPLGRPFEGIIGGVFPPLVGFPLLITYVLRCLIFLMLNALHMGDQFKHKVRSIGHPMLLLVNNYLDEP